MKKRITLIVGVIGTGLLVASLSTWLYLGRRGSSGLENWIGRQVLLVLRYHLTPDISFDDLDYQAPRTVVVRHLTFASEGQTFLEISQARLELAEIPRRNRPILVQSIELGEPRLRFIVRPGVDGLVGWTQFVRPKVIADPEVVPPEQRLSEVLVLRRVAIRNAEVVYETLNGAGERMTLPGISLEMQTPPVANEPGWYQLIGRLQREPLFDAQIDGRINLDTGLLEVARLQLQAAIGEAQYATLPPAVQTFLRKHEVRGQLSLSAKGHVPLDAPAKAAGTLKAELREACFRYADTMFPVRQVTLDARVPDGEIDLKVAGVNFTQRGRPLLSIGEIAVQLAGLPEAGEPVHIRQLTVNAPHATFDTGADGRLAGWHQLASAKPPGASTPRAADAQQPQAGSAPPAILQQVRLDAFAVCDGALTYRSGPEAEPFTLDGINLTLATSSEAPRANDASTTRPAARPELLRVAGKLQAGVLLAAKLEGALDTRTAVLDIQSLEANTTLTQDTAAHTSPAVRAWLNRYAFRGRFEAYAMGRIALSDPARSTLRAQARLAEASMRYREVDIPIEEARVEWKLPEGSLHASVKNFKLLQQGQPFFTLASADATLAGLRRASRINVDSLTLTEPRFWVVRARDGAVQSWNRLSSKDSPTGGTLPLIRRLEIKQAGVSYRSAFANEPVILDGLNGLLEMQRLQGTGTFALKGRLEQPALGAIDFAGRYDAQRGQAVLTQAKGEAHVPADDAGLPEPLRHMLREHAVRGTVTANWEGELPVSAPRQAKGRLVIQAEKAGFSASGASWSFASAQVEADLPSGPVNLAVGGLTVEAEKAPLLTADRATATVSTLPGKGETLRIDQLSLDRPKAMLISRRDGLAGWSQLFGRKPASPASTIAGGRPVSGNAPASGGSPHGSGVLLARLRVQNGELIYDSGDGRPRMQLPGISGSVELKPQENGATRYDFDAKLSGDASLSAAFAGRYAAPGGHLEVESLRVVGQFNERHYAWLPPALQPFVRDHRFRSQVDLSFKGVLNVAAPAQSKGQLQAALRDASITMGDSAWPIQSLNLKLTAEAGHASGKYNAAILGGEGQGEIEASLSAAGVPTRVTWKIDGVQLEQLSPQASAESRHAGRLNSQGNLQARLTGESAGPTGGSGTLTVRDGRLVRVPVIQHALDVLRAAPLGLVLPRKDSAEVSWDFRPHEAQIKSFAVKTAVATLRGEGFLDYDGRIELRMDAQLIRTAQFTDALGRVGQIIEGVREFTDQAMIYRVSGSTSKPTIIPEPLGIPMRIPGR